MTKKKRKSASRTPKTLVAGIGYSLFLPSRFEIVKIVNKTLEEN